jgi:hypothetical protein
MNIIKNVFGISDDEWSTITETVPPKGIIYLSDNSIPEVENILMSHSIDRKTYMHSFNSWLGC